MKLIGSIATALPPLLLLVLGCGGESAEIAPGPLPYVAAGASSGGASSPAGGFAQGGGAVARGGSDGAAVSGSGAGGTQAGAPTGGGAAPEGGVSGSPAGGLGTEADTSGAASGGNGGSAGATEPECAILKTKLGTCADCEIDFERCGSPPTAARWLTSNPALVFECSNASPLDCADAEERAKFWLANECCGAP